MQVYDPTGTHKRRRTQAILICLEMFMAVQRGARTPEELEEVLNRHTSDPATQVAAAMLFKSELGRV